MKVLLTVITILYSSFVMAQTKGASPVAPAPGMTPEGQPKNTYAVVVGISDYQDADIPDLRYADKDAEAFANFLRSPAGGGLSGDRIQILLNQNATAGRVAEALDALLEKTKEGDQVIIYFSGHGDVERKTISQPGFLLCWDSPSRVYMGGGTYSLAYLQEVVSTLSLQNKAKVFIITDACHAGKLAGSQINGSQLTAANLARQYANEIKILSCQPGELSLEGVQWGGGRGVFSYHLIDALAGMADRNGDRLVTLGELDRYLEDHVTAEAAPQSQVPLLLGNKTEQMATVNEKFLAQLKKEKAQDMVVFAATETRGLEEEVLARVDSATQQLYYKFKKAVSEKRFFNPETDCAERYYSQLTGIESIASLRGVMKRNYAAALQDDAQQVMNALLKTNVLQIECIGKTLLLEPIPAQLGRSAELLEPDHYMYKSLQARKLLFEGIVQFGFARNPDEKLGRQAISLYRQAIELEPGSPLHWARMARAYATALRNADSAFVCAHEASLRASAWVYPYTDLAEIYLDQSRLDQAKRAIDSAEAIDPEHPFLIHVKAIWYSKQNNGSDREKGLTLFEKYRSKGGPLYPCWHNAYGIVLSTMGKIQEAEAELLKGIAMDSNKLAIRTNLAGLYTRVKRFDDAEAELRKILKQDSTHHLSWHMLGVNFNMSGRYAEAVPYFKRAIELDSFHSAAWNSMGFALLQTKQYDEALTAVRQALSLDSLNVYAWNNLGNIAREKGQWEESEQYFKKAISLNPNFASTYSNYAELKVKAVDPAAALPLVEKALSLGYRNLDYLQSSLFEPMQALPEWKPLLKKYFPEQIKD